MQQSAAVPQSSGLAAFTLSTSGSIVKLLAADLQALPRRDSSSNGAVQAQQPTTPGPFTLLVRSRSIDLFTFDADGVPRLHLACVIPTPDELRDVAILPWCSRVRSTSILPHTIGRNLLVLLTASGTIALVQYAEPVVNAPVSSASQQQTRAGVDAPSEVLLPAPHPLRADFTPDKPVLLPVTRLSLWRDIAHPGVFIRHALAVYGDAVPLRHTVAQPSHAIDDDSDHSAATECSGIQAIGAAWGESCIMIMPISRHATTILHTPVPVVFPELVVEAFDFVSMADASAIPLSEPVEPTPDAAQVAVEQLLARMTKPSASAAAAPSPKQHQRSKPVRRVIGSVFLLVAVRAKKQTLSQRRQLQLVQVQFTLESSPSSAANSTSSEPTSSQRMMSSNQVFVIPYDTPHETVTRIVNIPYSSLVLVFFESGMVSLMDTAMALQFKAVPREKLTSPVAAIGSGSKSQAAGNDQKQQSIDPFAKSEVDMYARASAKPLSVQYLPDGLRDFGWLSDRDASVKDHRLLCTCTDDSVVLLSVSVHGDRRLASASAAPPGDAVPMDIAFDQSASSVASLTCTTLSGHVNHSHHVTVLPLIQGDAAAGLDDRMVAMCDDQAALSLHRLSLQRGLPESGAVPLSGLLDGDGGLLHGTLVRVTADTVYTPAAPLGTRVGHAITADCLHEGHPQLIACTGQDDQGSISITRCAVAVEHIAIFPPSVSHDDDSGAEIIPSSRAADSTGDEAELCSKRRKSSDHPLQQSAVTPQLSQVSDADRTCASVGTPRTPRRAPASSGPATSFFSSSSSSQLSQKRHGAAALGAGGSDPMDTLESDEASAGEEIGDFQDVVGLWSLPAVTDAMPASTSYHVSTAAAAAAAVARTRLTVFSFLASTRVMRIGEADGSMQDWSDQSGFELQERTLACGLVSEQSAVSSSPAYMIQCTPTALRCIRWRVETGAFIDAQMACEHIDHVSAGEIYRPVALGHLKASIQHCAIWQQYVVLAVSGAASSSSGSGLMDTTLQLLRLDRDQNRFVELSSVVVAEMVSRLCLTPIMGATGTVGGLLVAIGTHDCMIRFGVSDFSKSPSDAIALSAGTNLRTLCASDMDTELAVPESICVLGDVLHFPYSRADSPSRSGITLFALGLRNGFVLFAELQLSLMASASMSSVTMSLHHPSLVRSGSLPVQLAALPLYQPAIPNHACSGRLQRLLAYSDRATLLTVHILAEPEAKLLEQKQPSVSVAGVIAAQEFESKVELPAIAAPARFTDEDKASPSFIVRRRGLACAGLTHAAAFGSVAVTNGLISISRLEFRLYVSELGDPAVPLIPIRVLLGRTPRRVLYHRATDCLLTLVEPAVTNTVLPGARPVASRDDNAAPLLVTPVSMGQVVTDPSVIKAASSDSKSTEAGTGPKPVYSPVTSASRTANAQSNQGASTIMAIRARALRSAGCDPSPVCLLDLPEGERAFALASWTFSRAVKSSTPKTTSSTRGTSASSTTTGAVSSATEQKAAASGSSKRKSPDRPSTRSSSVTREVRVEYVCVGTGAVVQNASPTQCRKGRLLILQVLTPAAEDAYEHGPVNHAESRGTGSLKTSPALAVKKRRAGLSDPHALTCTIVARMTLPGIVYAIKPFRERYLLVSAGSSVLLLAPDFSVVVQQPQPQGYRNAQDIPPMEPSPLDHTDLATVRNRPLVLGSRSHADASAAGAPSSSAIAYSASSAMAARQSLHVSARVLHPTASGSAADSKSSLPAGISKEAGDPSVLSAAAVAGTTTTFAAFLRRNFTFIAHAMDASRFFITSIDVPPTALDWLSPGSSSRPNGVLNSRIGRNLAHHASALPAVFRSVPSDRPLANTANSLVNAAANIGVYDPSGTVLWSDTILVGDASDGPMLLRCVALQKTEAVAVNSSGPGPAGRSAASTATNTTASLGNVASSASASSSKVPRAQIKYEFHPVKRYHLSTGGFRQAQFSAGNANAVVTVDDQGSFRTWAVHTGSNASTPNNASAGPVAAATAALAPVLASTMVGSGPLDGIALLPEGVQVISPQDSIVALFQGSMHSQPPEFSPSYSPQAVPSMLPPGSSANKILPARDDVWNTVSATGGLCTLIPVQAQDVAVLEPLQQAVAWYLEGRVFIPSQLGQRLACAAAEFSSLKSAGVTRDAQRPPTVLLSGDLLRLFVEELSPSAQRDVVRMMERCRPGFLSMYAPWQISAAPMSSGSEMDTVTAELKRRHLLLRIHALQDRAC